MAIGQEFQYIQDILKDQYAKAIVNQLPKHSLMYNLAKKKVADFYGKQYVIPVQIGLPEAVAFRATNNYDLPGHKRASYDQAIIAMKRVYARVGIDGYAIESSKGAGGWVEALTNEIKSVTDALSIQLDRVLMMDGKGRLCQAESDDDGSGGVVVEAPGGIAGDTPETKWCRVGMTVDWYTAAGVNHADSVVITAINTTTNKVTFSGDVTAVVADDWMYIEDTYVSTTDNGEAMGLDGIISDANTPGATFEGIDRTAVPVWQAYVKTSFGLLDETKLQEALDAIDERTDATAPDKIITTGAIRNKLIDIMRGDRQVEGLDLKAGWKAIKYIGGSVELPLVVHKKCPAGYIYFPNFDHLKMYILKGITWDDKGGGVIKPVAGKDAYEAWLKFYFNFGTDCSNAHGKATGVTVSA